MRARERDGQLAEASDVLTPDAPLGVEIRQLLNERFPGLDVLDPEPALHHPLSDHPDRNLRKATA
jgi:hypothetical protein